MRLSMSCCFPVCSSFLFSPSNRSAACRSYAHFCSNRDAASSVCLLLFILLLLLLLLLLLSYLLLRQRRGCCYFACLMHTDADVVAYPTCFMLFRVSCCRVSPFLFSLVAADFFLCVYECMYVCVLHRVLACYLFVI